MPVTIVADNPAGETITLTPAQIADGPITIIVRDTLGGQLVVNGDAFNPNTPVTIRYPFGWTQTGPYLITDASPPEYITIQANWVVADVKVMCLVRGTLVDTPEGPRRIEDIRRGDLVLTRDRGAQPVRWIGSRTVDAATLAAHASLRPIRIRAGALGRGIPVQDLMVSPQHRILVRSAIARRMFGQDEVLVAARQLLALEGVEVDETAAEVEYFHLLLDRHEVIIANGVETESLHTGREALRSLTPEALAEILTLFPELASGSHVPQAARLLPRGTQGRRLAERHMANGKALVAPRGRKRTALAAS